MDTYVDTNMLIVRQIQAERRANAAAHRLAAECQRAQATDRRLAAHGGRTPNRYSRLLTILNGGRPARV